jgi:hypothetical protein
MAETGPGDAAARERLGALFASFDKLTPDDLGRIGMQLADQAERRELLDAVGEAARRTGREAMVAEARELARDAVLRRYSAGTLHPTWVALNWGISQGTVADRVAIVEVLTDAAAAAVVEDVLDPEIAEALALDAGKVVGLASGSASDGALGRALDRPADPDLGPTPTGRRLRIAFAGSVVGASIFLTAATVGVYAAAALGVGAGLLVAAVNRRRPG